MPDITELYRLHRPSELKDVVGQESVTKLIHSWIEDEEIPHAVLFTGASGVGKTTLARILANNMDCSGSDLQEHNSADLRGIDKAREIKKRMHTAPLQSACRIWILNEVHRWTKDCQNAMLDVLEETPKHAYFFLTTTNPEQLIKPIKTRCTDVNLRAVAEAKLMQVMKRVCKLADIKINKEVAEKIAKYSNGSPRKALVFLHAVSQLSSKNDMLNVIQEEETEAHAIDLARLLFSPEVSWRDLSKLLKKARKDNVEALRRLVLDYATTVMLNNPKGTGRAYLIIESFRENFFDSEFAGVVSACFEVISAK